jgi:hypothetical protein
MATAVAGAATLRRMGGFYVGLFFLALFLVGTLIYLLLSGHRPGMRDLDGASSTHTSDAEHQAELYERPHDHKH